MSSNWQMSKKMRKLYDKPKYDKFHAVPIDGKRMDKIKTYFYKSTWPNGNRWQGRFKFTVAFINYAGFNKKKLKKNKFGPQYVWGNVYAKTTEDLKKE